MKCRDLMAQLQMQLGADADPEMRAGLEALMMQGLAEDGDDNEGGPEDGAAGEEEEDDEEGPARDEEPDKEAVEELIRGDLLKGYLVEMEGRVKKAEADKTQLMEENHQLRLKMKEVLAMASADKGKDGKGQTPAATGKLIETLEKENTRLKTEVKTNLQEKLLLIQKLEKYDSIVEELRKYNQELLSALKSYEEQNKLLKSQKTFSDDEVNKIRSDIELYQKKVPTLIKQ
jgi:hypothetical protein